MSAYKRDENLKMIMSTGLGFMNMDTVAKETDKLVNNPKQWLEAKQFRTRVLLANGQNGTDALYKTCDGKFVQATFERIRREIQDIHFTHVCGASSGPKPKKGLIPVVDYSCSSNVDGKRAEISFKTRKGNRVRTVKLSLMEGPGSAVIQNVPRKMNIKIEVSGGKIPDDLKLKSLFSKCITDGELFIDFITEKLWPVFDKAEQAETARKVNESKASMMKDLGKLADQPKDTQKEAPNRSVAGNDAREAPLAPTIGLYNATNHASQVFGYKGGNGLGNPIPRVSKNGDVRGGHRGARGSGSEHIKSPIKMVGFGPSKHHNPHPNHHPMPSSDARNDPSGQKKVGGSFGSSSKNWRRHDGPGLNRQK